ncbi:hypothetical protein LguiA_028924 [Lonicera macranthoides]
MKTVASVKDRIQNPMLWRPDDRVLAMLEGTCFHQYANLFSHRFRHHVPMIAAVANCYDPESGVFNFGPEKVFLSLEDVVYITGLPVDGKAVTGLEGDHTTSSEKLLGKNGRIKENSRGKLKERGSVKLTWLRENFAAVPKNIDEEKLMCYVRAYVLYIIGSVVCPDKSATVPLMFLRLLRKEEDFNRYSWGAAMLAHLHMCLKEWYKGGTTCLAGHTLSLMFFAIERVPRLGIHMMGIYKPTKEQLQDFLKNRPTNFPLTQGWASKLHIESNNNHSGRDSEDIYGILKNLQPDDIVWEPYKRLDKDFLPEHLAGQQRMGLSHTILLCFERAVYHCPELCPKQFGLLSASRRDHWGDDYKVRNYKRGGAPTDWSKYRRMATWKKMWDQREFFLIVDGDKPRKGSRKRKVCEDKQVRRKVKGKWKRKESEFHTKGTENSEFVDKTLVAEAVDASSSGQKEGCIDSSPEASSRASPEDSFNTTKLVDEEEPELI